MKIFFLLPTLLLSLSLSAQFTLSVEQGMTISDNRTYKPVGIALSYQAAEWKGFNFSIGLAFDQVNLKEALSVSPELAFCDAGNCFRRSSWVESDESRLILPLGISRTANRFTYGFQLRPGLRLWDDITIPQANHLRGTRRIQFGESFPVSSRVSDQGEFTANKSPFSLQVGTDFQYAITERISFGLNYRYEGILNDDIKVVRNWVYTSEPVEIEYFRGEARTHYFVAMVGWRL